MVGLPKVVVKDASVVATPGSEDAGGSLAIANLEKGKETMKSAAGEAAGLSKPGDQMEDMMALLHLTVVESEAMVIDNTEDLNLIDSDHAFVGKVLAPNTLHIQMILSATRLAWVNPCGLVLNSAGDNLFIAEFGSMVDRDR
jgi:hypothetical protein